jgi:hypothetical protein
VTLDAQVIGAVFTGLIGLVAGFSTWTASRSRRVLEDRRLLRRTVRTLQKQLVATVEHVFALELILARHGIPAPDRPAILEATPDEDPSDQADRAPDRTGGRHARQG